MTQPEFICTQHPNPSQVSPLTLNYSAPWWKCGGLAFLVPLPWVDMAPNLCFCFFPSQVKEAMQRIHDRGNIGKLILDVEKTPTPLVSQKQSDPFSSTQQVWSGAGTDGAGGNVPGPGLVEVTSDNQKMAQIRTATNWDKCWKGMENSSGRAFQEQSEGSQERIETMTCVYDKCHLLAVMNRRNSWQKNLINSHAHTWQIDANCL